MWQIVKTIEGIIFVSQIKKTFSTQKISILEQKESFWNMFYVFGNKTSGLHFYKK